MKLKADRLILSYKMVSLLGLNLELKAKSGNENADESFSKRTSNSTEFALSYELKPFKNYNLILNPGFNAEFSNQKLIFKPSLLLNYTF